jgi:hypothetical protein
MHLYLSAGCSLPFYRKWERWRLLKVWICRANRCWKYIDGRKCFGNAAERFWSSLYKAADLFVIVKEPFVFGYWKLVILFSKTALNSGWLKLILVISFSIGSKGLNWMAPLLRNCSRFAAVSFLKGLQSDCLHFLQKTVKSFAMLAEYHRVHLKRWHLVFNAIVI